MSIFIIVVLLSLFSWWELHLLVSLILLPPEGRRRAVLKYEKLALDAIFRNFKRFAGFEVEFDGLAREELPERFLLVSNHQSLLDIPILMRLLPGDKRGRFVAKQDLGWGIPLISLLLRTAGHCLVKRKGDALHAMKSVEKMARRCAREGSIPVIFPEGHRSRTGLLGEFHSAGFRKILEAEKLPILVAALEGGRYVRTLKDFFRNFGKSPYRLRFVGLLPPPANKKEALASLGTSRSMIAAALEEMRER